MSDFSLLLNLLRLLLLLLFQCRILQRYFKQWWATWQQHHPRRWKPQSPHDRPHCQAGIGLQLVPSKRDLLPYSARKSRRGRKKTIPTRGFACPNPACDYCSVTDDTIHAMAPRTAFSASNVQPAARFSPAASTIQTAFVKRVNLTFRQSVPALSRRTWAYTQTERHLLLHCEGFRLYYHLVRAHEALALEISGLKRRYRSRSPAMALGLTTHLWAARDLLHYPVPRVA